MNTTRKTSLKSFWIPAFKTKNLEMRFHFDDNHLQKLRTFFPTTLPAPWNSKLLFGWVWGCLLLCTMCCVSQRELNSVNPHLSSSCRPPQVFYWYFVFGLYVTVFECSSFHLSLTMENRAWGPAMGGMKMTAWELIEQRWHRVGDRQILWNQ